MIFAGVLAVLGGAPLLVASSTGTLFGVWDQVSVAAVLTALPIATWELSVGVYMVIRGFRTPQALAAQTTVEPAARPALATA